MFSQQKSEYTEISIDAIDYVNFSKIDSRIKHDGEWMQRYPMGTYITVPTKNADEIIEKLKKDNSITCVGNEITAKGIEINEKMRPSF